MKTRQTLCAVVVDIESLVTFTQTDRQFKYRYNSEREGIYSLQSSYDANVLAVGYGDGTIEARSCTPYYALV